MVLVGIMGALRVFAITWSDTFLPMLVTILFIGGGRWLAGVPAESPLLVPPGEVCGRVRLGQCRPLGFFRFDTT